MLRFFVNLPSCLIGIEACGAAHYWARELSKLGHKVKLMSPQYVKPYVKTNKHDIADAEAICKAVMRPNMRFVSVKSGDQQAILSVHRARQGFVKVRTAQVNQIRGLLAESGIVMSRGIQTVKKRLPEILENGENGLSGIQRQLLHRLMEHLKELDRQVNELESEIHRWHKANESSQKLASIPGLGPLTASALVATIGNALDFKNGRQLADWLGIVPKQHSRRVVASRIYWESVSEAIAIYERYLFLARARWFVALKTLLKGRG